MRVVQAVAVYAPESLTIPLTNRGRREFKLGGMARSNGIPFSEEEAHDALADVRATLDVARLVARRAPDIWDQMMRNARKRDVNEFVRENAYFYLTNFFSPGAFNEVVTFAGRNPQNENEIAVLTLAGPPERYLDLEAEALLDVLRGSPKVIRTIRANSQPIIMPFRTPPDEIRGGALNEDTYVERADAVSSRADFHGRVSAVLPGVAEREISPYVEQRLYDGFPSPDDEQLKKEFHECPWADREDLCGGFEDERLAELGLRLIYMEHPEVLSEAERARWGGWVVDRLTTDEDVPWLTVGKALIELQDIRRNAIPEAQGRLEAIEDYLLRLPVDEN